jgi:hypothetical protein
MKIVVAAALALTVSWSAVVAAEVPDAKQLYARAEKALADEDHVWAARNFAAADELKPHPSALEAALLSVLRTDLAALAMDLAGRTERDPTNHKLSLLAASARDKFAARAGRLVVHCDGCGAVVDGAPHRVGVATWLNAGPHRVLMLVDGRRQKHDVEVLAGEVVTVAFEATPSIERVTPEPGPDDVESTEGGASPAFFWIGLGLTTALGAGTVISFADTAAKHDEFEQAPSPELAAAGDAAQTRTRVLLGVTGGIAVATILLGVFADWDGDDVALGENGLRWRF